MSRRADAERALGAAFEVEAGSPEEFLRLLELRETEAALAQEYRRVPRRAIYVAPLQDVRRVGQSPWPSVRRYVRAGFAYGEDLVSYTQDTSNGLEIPDFPDSAKPRERQMKVYEELRGRIESWIRERGLDALPVLDGYLCHVNERGAP